MARVYEFQGVVPVIDPAAFVHPDAVLIGDVIVGPGVFIGPAAVLRGDFGRLVIGPGANVQDNCVVHGFPDWDTTIEEDGHIGHCAIIHGAMVRKNALVGMGATILDFAEIGESAVVAAQALVPANTKVPPRTLWAGVPARQIRELKESDIEWKRAGTRDYQNLARLCLETLKPARPLAAVEPDRKRTNACSAPAKFQTKA
jgi:phenylacetic acid degradation protein